jgi:hypothetical protein
MDASRQAVRSRSRLVWLWRLGLLVALAAALQFGGRWAGGQVEDVFLALQQEHGAVALYAVVAVYVVAMALPYVPGIEISLALLMIFGADGVAVVYLSTLLALCLSYGVGRLIPPRAIARFFGWLHLRRAQALVERLGPLSREERLQALLAAAPSRVLPSLLRHRYLAVAVAFNVPGNALLGGGGGIALAAGLSGLFRFPRFVLMVCVAISPIPLLILTHHWFTLPLGPA